MTHRYSEFSAVNEATTVAHDAVFEALVAIAGEIEETDIDICNFQRFWLDILALHVITPQEFSDHCGLGQSGLSKPENWTEADLSHGVSDQAKHKFPAHQLVRRSHLNLALELSADKLSMRTDTRTVRDRVEIVKLTKWMREESEPALPGIDESMVVGEDTVQSLNVPEGATWDTPLEEYPLYQEMISDRLKNLLRDGLRGRWSDPLPIKTLRDLAEKTTSDLEHYRNIGAKRREELNKFMAAAKISFGTQFD